MSKKKDIERAKNEGRFQERQERKDEPRFLCPFPSCGKVFWKEEGKPNVCPDHRKLIADVHFILEHSKTQAVQDTPSGLIIPRPGASMEAAANDAIKRKERGKT